MESAQEYFLRMHKSLANNYRTPDNRFSESCSYIACEIAKRLLSEKIKPTIYWVGRISKDEWFEMPMLEPLR